MLYVYLYVTVLHICMYNVPPQTILIWSWDDNLQLEIVSHSYSECASGDRFCPLAMLYARLSQRLSHE